MYLDYYITPKHPRPCLMTFGGKDVTAKCFKALKKMKHPALTYFQINFSEQGREEISVNIPAAFAGVVLRTISDAVFGTD